MLRTALIGHTGFVGSNLRDQMEFTDFFNSTDIEEIEGVYDLVVCAGIPAVKWMANKEPEKDWQNISRLLTCLKRVKASTFVLISTVDVYASPRGVDERTPAEGDNHTYGRHRYLAERFVADTFPHHHILRLPGLFGPGLKKNFIYDLLHQKGLEAIHPESTFQFYDLKRLGSDLARVRKHDLELVNVAVEPLRMEEIRSRFFPELAIGGSASVAGRYDMRSMHAEAFGGRDGYLYDKEAILSDLDAFISSQRTNAVGSL